MRQVAPVGLGRPVEQGGGTVRQVAPVGTRSGDSEITGTVELGGGTMRQVDQWD